MVKLLSIISLILALVLFPPAVLAVISNNAIPGDSTYSIKRSMEDIIFTMASINPTTKAWFSAARSDRRFTEFKTLVAQGKKGADTLNELVEQTNIAASQIAQVADPIEKAKLIEQLSTSIEKYDQGLKQVTSPSSIPDNDSTTSDSNPQVTALPQATTSPSVRPETQPTVHPTVQPTARPTPVPTSTARRTTQTPTPAAQVTPVPTLAPQPTPVPNQDKANEEQRQKEIEEARKRLEEINKRLHQQSGEEKIEKTEDKRKDENKAVRDDHSDKSKEKGKFSK